MLEELLDLSPLVLRELIQAVVEEIETRSRSYGERIYVSNALCSAESPRLKRGGGVKLTNNASVVAHLQRGRHPRRVVATIDLLHGQHAVPQELGVEVVSVLVVIRQVGEALAVSPGAPAGVVRVRTPLSLGGHRLLLLGLFVLLLDLFDRARRDGVLVVAER